MHLVADCQVRRVERDQRKDALGRPPGQELRDDRPGVVTGHYEALDAQVVEQGKYVRGQAIRGVRVFGLAFGLVLIPESAEIRCYNVGFFGEG